MGEVPGGGARGAVGEKSKEEQGLFDVPVEELDLRHALAKGRPWKSPRWAVYHHLESPGTKAYTERETRALLSQFRIDRMWTEFLGGDLLQMTRSE